MGRRCGSVTRGGPGRHGGMGFPSAAQGTGQQARSRRACGPLSGRVAQAAIRGNNSEKSQLNSARMPAQAVCCGCVFPFISRPAGEAVGGGGAMRRSARQLPRAPRDGSRGPAGVAGAGGEGRLRPGSAGARRGLPTRLAVRGLGQRVIIRLVFRAAAN